MDVFAVILITITILTICGICLFILICAVQPKVLHYLHKKRERIYYITALKRINEAEASLSMTYGDDESKPVSSDEDQRRSYLKILERSVRSGRQIQDEKENNDIKNDSHLNSFDFLRRFIDQHLYSSAATTSTTTVTNIRRCTEL